MQSQHTQENEQPQNFLERSLVEAKAGRLPLESFLKELLTSELFISSTRDAGEDGTAFMPLLFDRDGVPMAAVFTTLSRAALHKDQAPFSLRMNGLELFRRMPAGYGVVVNPGHHIRMEIQPQGVKEMVRDLGQ